MNVSIVPWPLFYLGMGCQSRRQPPYQLQQRSAISTLHYASNQTGVCLESPPATSGGVFDHFESSNSYSDQLVPDHYSHWETFRINCSLSQSAVLLQSPSLASTRRSILRQFTSSFNHWWSNNSLQIIDGICVAHSLWRTSIWCPRRRRNTLLMDRHNKVT